MVPEYGVLSFGSWQGRELNGIMAPDRATQPPCINAASQARNVFPALGTGLNNGPTYLSTMSISRIPTVSRPPFIYGICSSPSCLESLCRHRIWKFISSITSPFFPPMCLYTYSVLGHCRSAGSPDPRKPAQRRNTNTVEPRHACSLHRCMQVYHRL